MIIKVVKTVEVEVPEKATHYAGDLTDEPRWYLNRCPNIPVKTIRFTTCAFTWKFIVKRDPSTG